MTKYTRTVYSYRTESDVFPQSSSDYILDIDEFNNSVKPISFSCSEGSETSLSSDAQYDEALFDDDDDDDDWLLRDVSVSCAISSDPNDDICESCQ